MLYNIEKKQIKDNSHCLECKFFDKNTHKCSGIGKVCFEYDKSTDTIIDNTTGLPLNRKVGN